MNNKTISHNRSYLISNGVKKTLLVSVVLIFFSLAPVVTLAADGCGSVGPNCTINGNAGTCAQNDIGDFYCRPNALDIPVTSTGDSGFVPLASIPGLTQGVTADTAGLANFFNNLYKFAIGMAAALAVIMIIWGGIEYSTQDSISKKSDGKQRIYQAILGLVLVLSPVLVFSIINPSILNLSINLERLDTRSGPSSTTGTGTVADAVTAATAAGCTVTDTGTLTKTAECTTENGERDAQNFVANCRRVGGIGRVQFLPRYEGNNTLRTYRATCDMTPPVPAGESTNDDLLNPN